MRNFTAFLPDIPLPLACKFIRETGRQGIGLEFSLLLSLFQDKESKEIKFSPLAVGRISRDKESNGMKQE